MPFTLIESRIQTLTQQGEILSEISQTGSAVLTGGLNSVTELKRLYSRFTVDTAGEGQDQIVLPSAKLFVNWAFYLPIGIALSHPFAPPTTGFSVTLPATIDEDETPSAINMPFYTSGNPYPESCRNFECRIYLYSATNFAIEVDYYITFDEDGYMNGATKSNEFRFISEYWNQLNTLVVENSVFNVEKEIRLLTFINNTPFDSESEIVEEIQEFTLYQGQVSKFDTQIEITNANTSESINYIPSTNDTNVTAKFYSDFDIIGRFFVKLIRIQNEPHLDFISSYELNENEVDPSNLFENAIKPPFNLSYSEDYGGYYDLSFTIDHTYLTEGATYRLVFVGYDLVGESYLEEINYQGISNPFTVTPIVGYCTQTDCVESEMFPKTLIFTPTLIDLEKEYTGNFLLCAIEERMRAKLTVDYSDDRWKNNLDCRLDSNSDLNITNDLRNYLKGIEIEIYEETMDPNLGLVTNTLEKHFLNKTAPNTYTGTGIVYSIDTINEILTLTYDFRNRNETNTPALATKVNNLPYLPVIGNQYWGGKSIYIKWTLVFFYNNWPTPFIDRLNVTQRMFVRDYSTTVTIVPSSGNTFFCPAEPFCFTASIILADPEDYWLINTEEIVESGGNITESENFTPNLLSQETDPVFSSQQADFTGGDAIFCVNASGFFVNQNYKFTAMAKKKQ